MMRQILLLSVMVAVLISLLAMPVLADKGKPSDIPSIPLDKQVQDEQLKKELKDKGIDVKYVMLAEDYSKEHPNTQKYTNLLNGDTIAIIDSIPHVNAQGQDIQATWLHFTYSGNDWEAGINTFTAKVYGTEVKLEQDGERLWWNPELYLKGNRIYPVSNKATRINDTYNSNYYGNILTWDYGVCIRELRLIEGAIFEKWVFNNNPNGEVIIKHRQGGHIKLQIGYMNDGSGMPYPVEVQQGDWEIVSADTFNLPYVEYPVYLSASMTFYAAVGNHVGTFPSPTQANDWATLRTNPGDWGAPGGVSYWGDVFFWTSYPTANKYANLVSSAFIFDTSGLNDAVTITSASFSLFGYGKADPLSDGGLSVNIYNTTTLYNDRLVVTDYGRRGNTAYCATPITYANWSVSGYNSFVLNAAGLSAISLTGYTKIAARDVLHDVGGAAPVWGDGYFGSGFLAYWAAMGESYTPKLIVVYTPANPAITVLDVSSLAATSARLNAIITSDGGEACEVRFGYGTTSQTAVNFGAYDTITSWSTGYATGDHPYFDATGLLLNTPYYYRVQIKNTTSTVTSTDQITFTTLNAILPPGNMTAKPGDTFVNLHWVPGQGSSSTYILASYEDYPGNITDGRLVCDTVESNWIDRGLSDVGLDSGKPVFYSAWGKGAGIGNVSATYTTILATTRLDISIITDTETPGLPAGFTQEPDYTAFSGLPGYVGINQLADDLNMPRASLWLMLQIGIMGGMTIAISMVAGTTLGIIAGGAIGAGFVMMGGMPSGFIVMVIIFAVGYGVLRWRMA